MCKLHGRSLQLNGRNKFYFLNKFIYFWLHWVFITAHWLWRAGATLRCGTRASHCGGISCCGARALGVRASVVVARGL